MRPNRASAIDPAIMTTTKSTPRIALNRVKILEVKMSRSGRELVSSTVLARPCETLVATSAEVRPFSVVTAKEYLPNLADLGHVIAKIMQWIMTQ
jgi:hypothetical protein